MFCPDLIKFQPFLTTKDSSFKTKNRAAFIWTLIFDYQEVRKPRQRDEFQEVWIAEKWNREGGDTKAHFSIKGAPPAPAFKPEFQLFFMKCQLIEFLCQFKGIQNKDHVWSYNNTKKNTTRMKKKREEIKKRAA